MAGLKALLAGDVVISDLLAPRALLAWLAPSVAEIDVAKVPRSRFTAQEAINALLATPESSVEASMSCSNSTRRGSSSARVFSGLSPSTSVPALAAIR